jgi:hypothetical protein
LASAINSRAIAASSASSPTKLASASPVASIFVSSSRTRRVSARVIGSLLDPELTKMLTKRPGYFWWIFVGESFK